MKILFKETAVIKRENSEVFDFVAGLENIPTYMPAVVRCETAGESDVLTVGTKLNETRLVFGKEATAQVEVSRFEKNKVFAIKSKNGGIFGEYVFDFSRKDEFTELTLTAFVESRGIMKIFSPIFTFAMKKNDSGQVYRIKKSLEQIK